MESVRVQGREEEEERRLKFVMHLNAVYATVKRIVHFMMPAVGSDLYWDLNCIPKEREGSKVGRYS